MIVMRVFVIYLQVKIQLEIHVFSNRLKFKVVLADCQTCECDLFLGEFVIFLLESS